MWRRFILIFACSSPTCFFNAAVSRSFSLICCTSASPSSAICENKSALTDFVAVLRLDRPLRVERLDIVDAREELRSKALLTTCFLARGDDDGVSPDVMGLLVGGLWMDGSGGSVTGLTLPVSIGSAMAAHGLFPRVTVYTAT